MDKGTELKGKLGHIKKDMKKEYKKFWKVNHKMSFRVWKKKRLYY